MCSATRAARHHGSRPVTTSSQNPGSRYRTSSTLPDVSPTGVGGHTESGGQLDDRELRDARRAGTGEREAGVATELHIGARLIDVDLVSGAPLDDQLQLLDLRAHLGLLGSAHRIEQTHRGGLLEGVSRC